MLIRSTLDPLRAGCIDRDAEETFEVLALLLAVRAFSALWAALGFKCTEGAFIVVAHDLVVFTGGGCAIKVTSAHLIRVRALVTYVG